MTSDRRETKYLIASEQCAALVRALRRELTPHRFTGPGANLLPGAQHFSTTIYFDTRSHALLRLACDNLEQNVKLRAREYYDLHPSLAEVATHADQIVRYQPWVWLELKRRERERTVKHRLRLDKSKLAAFLRGAVHDEGGSSGEDEDGRAIVDFCRDLGEALGPSVLVNYRRQAFQDASGTLRVTIDRDLSFYVPPADLWSQSRALVRGTFGRARAVDDLCLVEVKQRAVTPTWLDYALSEIGAQRTSLSKFQHAGRAVYGF